MSLQSTDNHEMSGCLGYSSEITIAKVNHRALNMEVAYTQEISIPENYPLMNKQNWVSHPKHSQMVHEKTLSTSLRDENGKEMRKLVNGQ